MKGVPIKFRAKRINSADYVYGFFGRTPSTNKPLIVDVSAFKSYTVEENSVAQLIGYDAEGNEVYEGDIVDAFFDDKPEPVYNFQALLLNNFLVPENLKNVKHIVRRNAE